MRRFLNQWREPIYKDDVKRAILYGLINMIIFSLFAGAVQFFVMTYLGLGFGILVFLIAFMIAKRIKDNVSNYHILYSFIATLLFIIGYFLYYVTMYAFYFHDPLAGFQMIFSWYGMSNIIFAFLNYKTYVGIDIFNNIMDILILGSALVYAWRYPKGR